MKGGNTLTIFKLNEDFQRFVPLLVKGDSFKTLREWWAQSGGRAIRFQKALINLRERPGWRWQAWSFGGILERFAACFLQVTLISKNYPVFYNMTFDNGLIQEK